MEKPFGSDWDFTDAGWILPFGFVMFAMLGGDFGWATGLMVVANLILAGHVWYETRRNMPRKKQGSWHAYTVLSFIVSLVLTEYFMVIYAIIAYTAIAGELKRDLNKERIQPRYYNARIKTFQRMGIMAFAVACIFGVRYVQISDNVKTLQEQELIRKGVIAPNQAKYNKQ